MVRIHPCDMMWQGILSSLITRSFMPPTAPSIFSLSNFIISWSCWIQWLWSSGRLRQRGLKQNPHFSKPCIPLPSSSYSLLPRVALCILYAFLLPILQGQQKPEVGCRVKHPTEQIAIAKCALIILSPQQLWEPRSKFPCPCSLASWPRGGPDWWLWISVNK